ncbi:L,D-transpeptidase [Ottowia sp.]|uniref:L,D-transpeptidase n=1 Tax=Ottowia sp. TaxID=1898956 RepID=UPI003A86915A
MPKRHSYHFIPTALPLSTRLRPALAAVALVGAAWASTTSAWAAGDSDLYALPDAAAEARAVNLAASVMRHADAAGRAFGIIDKQAATLWVFDGRGQPVASTPVLVGAARGDVAPPDIGTRPLARVRPHEKVTSAGRYVTEPGENHRGEDIVWLDYDSALSMHRVRHVSGESRPQRLASATVADNRISFGCVNIPPHFYDRYIDPLFSRSSGVVYVLPESRSLASVFPFAANMSSTPVAQGAKR